MDFFTKKTIYDLDISVNTTGWGPCGGDSIDGFGDIPYAHFDKKDKIFKASDFASVGQVTTKIMKPRRDDSSHVNAEFAYRHDAAEDSTFQLVDTAKQSKLGRKPWGAQNKQQNRNFGRGGPQGKKELQVFMHNGKNGRKGGKGNNRPMRRIQRFDRVPSIAIHSDWKVVEEFDLVQLLKLQANTPKVEDLKWCGHLDQYNETFEKVTTRASKPLQKIENKNFYSFTTKDDPVMEKFASEGVAQVFATDSILSTLVAAPRSVYSWDIVIEKIDGKIFLDKRENDFDFLTVSETAQDPPSATDEYEEYNHPEKLSVEATAINQNFSQQVLVADATKRTRFEPNPFYNEEDGGEPASIAYRYRKFALGEIDLVVRCEVNGKTSKNQFMTCYALNEWDSKFSGGMNWRQKIDQQRGAVLGTEIKNNSCKLAKWAVQSVLADVELMKVGYVSRVSPTNPFDHVVLSTQSFKPKEFSTQINLNLPNIWGIIKMFCDLLSKHEDGKYILIKDPIKSSVRLYSVPSESFEDDNKELDGDDGLVNSDDEDDI